MRAGLRHSSRTIASEGNFHEIQDFGACSCEPRRTCGSRRGPDRQGRIRQLGRRDEGHGPEREARRRLLRLCRGHLAQDPRDSRRQEPRRLQLRAARRDRAAGAQDGRGRFREPADADRAQDRRRLPRLDGRGRDRSPRRRPAEALPRAHRRRQQPQGTGEADGSAELRRTNLYRNRRRSGRPDQDIPRGPARRASAFRRAIITC